MRNLYLLIIMLFISCGKQDNYDETVSVDAALVSVMDEKDVDNQPPPPSSISEKLVSTSAPQTTSSKIIKDGKIEIEVGDITKSQKIITENLKKNNAYKQGEFLAIAKIRKC